MKHLIFALMLVQVTSHANTQIVKTPSTIIKPTVTAYANYMLSSTKASNTSNTNKVGAFNVGGDYVTINGRWAQHYGLDSVNGEHDKHHTAFAKAMRLANTNSLTPQSYFFGKLKLEKDEATVYDFSLMPTVGYGTHLLQDRNQRLVAEAGIGLQYLKQKQIGSDIEVLVNVVAEYQRQLNQRMSIEQGLGIDYGRNMRVLRSRTAFVLQLADNFSGQVGYHIKNIENNRLDIKNNMIAVGVRYTP